MTEPIGIAGEGAWGRALAHVAARAGQSVVSWARDRDPGILAGSKVIVLAVPAQACREVLRCLAPVLSRGLPLIIAAKGIEQTTGRFMHEVADEEAPKCSAMVLSGPSFAADVMRDLPTAVTLAGPTLAEAARIAGWFAGPAFRVYASDDVRGVEIGGALKNVLAIACGISDGRGLGDSARAALTTRGFAELMRFGRKLGAQPDTLTGLSGLGDLLLTCSSRQSRNYGFGFAIGRGSSPAQARATITGVIEGAHTASIAAALAGRHGIDMPIVRAVHAIIDEGAAPGDEISRLMQRPLRPEFAGREET